MPKSIQKLQKSPNLPSEWSVLIGNMRRSVSQPSEFGVPGLIANDANDYVTMFALNVEPITIHHLL